MQISAFLVSYHHPIIPDTQITPKLSRRPEKFEKYSSERRWGGVDCTGIIRRGTIYLCKKSHKNQETPMSVIYSHNIILIQITRNIICTLQGNRTV